METRGPHGASHRTASAERRRTPRSPCLPAKPAPSRPAATRTLRISQGQCEQTAAWSGPRPWPHRTPWRPPRTPASAWQAACSWRPVGVKPAVDSGPSSVQPAGRLPSCQLTACPGSATTAQQCPRQTVPTLASYCFLLLSFQGRGQAPRPEAGTLGRAGRRCLPRDTPSLHICVTWAHLSRKLQDSQEWLSHTIARTTEPQAGLSLALSDCQVWQADPKPAPGCCAAPAPARSPTGMVPLQSLGYPFSGIHTPYPWRASVGDQDREPP